MEQERKSTTQTTNATVNGNTIAFSTVAKSTALDSIGATVLDYTTPERTLKILLNISQP